MATKIQRIGRIVGIAIGAVKAIFRTGRAWGTARTRVATVRRPTPTVSTGAAVAAGAAGGAAGAYFLDPKQGKRRRGMAFGRIATIAHRGESGDENGAGDAEGATKRSAAETNGASSRAPTRETVATAR